MPHPIPHPNAHRGEVPAEIDGELHVLKLTLGALAEVEAALGTDILALVARLERGELAAREALAIIAAALRAAGNPIEPADLSSRQIGASPADGFRLVADLFAAAFADADTAG